MLQRYDSGLRVLPLKSLVIAILGALTEGKKILRQKDIKAKIALRGDDFTGGRVGRGAMRRPARKECI